jgi:uncharacterized protein (DUF1330 family)
MRMPAYLFIKTKIHNRDEYMRYVAAVRSVGKQYNARYIVRSQPVEVLEGDAGEWGDYLLMVSEFPTVEAAREFWRSPEYREVRKLREGHGTVHVMLSESLP